MQDRSGFDQAHLHILGLVYKIEVRLEFNPFIHLSSSLLHYKLNLQR